MISHFKNTSTFKNTNVITLTALLEFPQQLFVVFRPNTNHRCVNKGSSRPGPSPACQVSFTTSPHVPSRSFFPPFLTWLNRKFFTTLLIFFFCESSRGLLSTPLPQPASYHPCVALVCLLHWTGHSSEPSQGSAFATLSPSLGLST